MLWRVLSVDCADSIDKPLTSCATYIIGGRRVYGVEMEIDWFHSSVDIKVYVADEDAVGIGFTVAEFNVFEDALRYAVDMLLDMLVKEKWINRLWIKSSQGG